MIDGWEVYVRGKLDQGYQMVVAGSNASLLSRELGTKLTGRHISKELFPFSFVEFCEFLGKAKNAGAVSDYLTLGGFPQYLQFNEDEILNACCFSWRVTWATWLPPTNSNKALK